MTHAFLSESIRSAELDRPTITELASVFVSYQNVVDEENADSICHTYTFQPVVGREIHLTAWQYRFINGGYQNLDHAPVSIERPFLATSVGVWRAEREQLPHLNVRGYWMPGVQPSPDYDIPIPVGDAEWRLTVPGLALERMQMTERCGERTETVAGLALKQLVSLNFSKPVPTDRL